MWKRGCTEITSNLPPPTTQSQHVNDGNSAANVHSTYTQGSEAAEASGILLGMNTGEFSGAIDSQLPFPSDMGDLDMDIGSDDGSLSESILPQNVAPGEIVFGTGMGASGSVPTTITHLGGGNREAPPPPRRSARKVTATN